MNPVTVSWGLGGGFVAEQSSITIEWTIENNLTVPIAMHVPPGSLVCDEWSGKSNPTIYNDLVVWPGQPHILRMEVQNPAWSMSKAYWSEQFTLPDGSIVANLRFTYGDDGTCADPCYDTQMWNGTSFESPTTVPLDGPTPETVGSATMSRAGNTYGRLAFHT